MSKGTKRLTVILGGLLVFAMVSSGLLPLLNPARNQVIATQVVPTDAPMPTLPPPPDDLSVFTFDQDIVHPTGLFSIAQPPGWLPLAPITPDQTALQTAPELNLNNSDRSSIIQAVVQPAAGLDDLDQLNAYYTSEVLRQSWSAYSSWRELTRRRAEDKLVIDFELTNRLGQTFVARQEAWIESGWLHRLRVIAPENAAEMVRYLMDNLKPTLRLNTVLGEVPADWKGYFDPATNLAIRFPADWALADYAPGRAASFSGDGAMLRVEAIPGTAAADEAAARAWVESSRAGVSVSSVEPVTRGDLDGFSVAYSYADADGNPMSGLAVLLNDDARLYVANLRLERANVDLNSEAGRADYANLAQVMHTFTVLAGVNVPLPTPTPSPTPLVSPTPAPIVEPTAESTPDAETTAEAESTPES